MSGENNTLEFPMESEYLIDNLQSYFEERNMVKQYHINLTMGRQTENSKAGVSIYNRTYRPQIRISLNYPISNKTTHSYDLGLDTDLANLQKSDAINITQKVIYSRFESLHGQYFCYWYLFTTKNNYTNEIKSVVNKSQVIEFNMLNNNQKRSIAIKCLKEKESAKYQQEFPVDYVYSTTKGLMGVCPTHVPDMPSMGIKLGFDFFDENGISDPTMTFVSGLNALEIDNKQRNYNMNNIRVIRLDAQDDLKKDILMYEIGKTYIYYSNNETSRRINMASDQVLSQIRVMKSRFLVIDTYDQKRGVSFTFSHIFDYQSHEDFNRTMLPMDKLFDCLINYTHNPNMTSDQAFNNTKNWERCTYMLNDTIYVNSYNLNEQGDYIFEYTLSRNISGTQNQSNMNNTFNKTDKIDVYVCRFGTETSCNQLINDWKEKVDKDAIRYTGSNYMLQFFPAYNTTTKDLVFHFWMSAKRYKSHSREVINFTISKNYSEDHLKYLSYYFDEISEVLYITGSDFSKAFRIDQVKLRIEFTDFNESTYDEYFNNDSTINKTKNMPQNIDIKWTNFSLTFDGVNKTHYIAWSNKSVIGNYFFMPRLDEKVTKPKDDKDKEYHKLEQKIPMGMQKSIDILDMFKGSFIKLQAEIRKNSTQDISNSYLDPYVFKISLKKARFIEDIYMVDTEIGEKRKVYIVASTKNENYVFQGDRFSTNMVTTITKRFSMRDFRLMTDFYPVSPTEGLVQIQELIYTLKPFEEGSNAELPSKGVNGVCLNSTMLQHDRLGPLHFCIFESKAFYKELMEDSSIKQMGTSKEAQDVLKSIETIKYIKRSDNFMNHILVFYFAKVDLSKEDAYKRDDLVLAIMRIDHKSDPRLMLVSKYIMPYHRNKDADDKFNIRADLICLEIAGDKVIHIEKASNITGEFRIGITSVEKGKAPQFLYYVPIPNDLSIDPNMKLIVSNLQDENDIELNQNTVLNIQPITYQICFKAMLTETRENKVVIFNPHVPSFSSLSIIELPKQYKVLEFGPLFTVSKHKKTISLAILASLSKTSEEDFMSKEIDLFIFLVTDMTPTIQLKQYKTTEYITKYMSNEQIKESNNQVFTFNVTSNIYSAEKIEENKQKSDSTKSLLDDLNKRAEITYELWGNPFDARLAISSKTNSIAIEIHSKLYVKHVEEFIKEQERKKKEKGIEPLIKDPERLLDLSSFFIRLDPMQYTDGHIFSYKGLPESSIEGFMGIVKVLNTSSSGYFKMNESIREELKQLNERNKGKITMDWSCKMKPEPHELLTYINRTERTLMKVRCCEEERDINIIGAWTNHIYKVNSDSVSSLTTEFSLTAKAYITQGDYVFFVERSYGENNTYVRLCRHNIMKDVTNKEKYQDCKGRAGYASIPINSLKVPKNFSDIDLNLSVFPFSIDDRFIICMSHYNKLVGIYTMVEIFDVNFLSQTKMVLNYLGALYVSSDNLQLAFSSDVKQVNENSNDRMNVELDISLVYYRWRSNTKLTLMNDVVTLKYEKNYAEVEANRAITPRTGSSNEVQGFQSTVDGELNKYAILLYDMSESTGIMKSICEHLQLIVPIKTYNESFMDVFTYLEDNILKTEMQRVFRIVVNFRSSNAYLIHISLPYLKVIRDKEKNNLKNGNSSRYDKELGGLRVYYDNFKIAPIENPFIGFIPDPDSPAPQLIENYFFMTNNYKDKFFFIAYTIENDKMIKRPDMGGDNKTKANIFGIDINNTANNISYFSETRNNYMRVNMLVQLESRPAAAAVIPNVAVKNYLEHRLIYFNAEERVQMVNFTTHINVRVKTHKVASRKIDLNITGKFGHNRTIEIVVKGDSTTSFWSSVWNIIMVCILLGVSLVIALCMMLVIEKDVQMTLKENSQVVARHSLKPVIGLMSNFIGMKVFANEDLNKDESQEGYEDVSSEENDEPNKVPMLSTKETHEPAERKIEPEQAPRKKSMADEYLD